MVGKSVRISKIRLLQELQMIKLVLSLALKNSLEIVIIMALVIIEGEEKTMYMIFDSLPRLTGLELSNHLITAEKVNLIVSFKSDYHL